MRPIHLQLVALAALFVGPAGAAAPGDVDPAFVYQQPATREPDSTNAIPLADGFLVVRSRNFGVAGQRSTLELTRIDEDGRIVPAWGNGGTVTVTLPATLNLSLAARRLANGRFLLAGYRKLERPDAAAKESDTVAAIARFDGDGRLDETFGVGGIATLDVPGDLDRVGAVDVLPDGRIVAGVWSRIQVDPYDCDLDRVELARLAADGSGAETLFYSGRSEFVASSCRRALNMQVLDQQELLYPPGWAILFGVQSGIIAYTSWEDWSDTVDTNGLYGPFVFEEQTGFAFLRQSGSGPVLRRGDPSRPEFPAPPIVGSGPQLGRLAGIHGGITEMLMVAERSRPSWYVGFANDSGQVGVAKFVAGGYPDPGWGGGDGVVPIVGSGTPDASDGVLYASHGLAADARMISVRPSGNVVVATADGVIQRLLGPSLDLSRGGIVVQDSRPRVTEGQDLSLRVSRRDGTRGAISVEYRVFSTTDCEPVSRVGCADAVLRPASADDFVVATGRLDWADGDAEDRSITIRTRDDREREPVELFWVELHSPTNGAVVISALTEVAIVDDDAGSSGGGSGGSSGGGGSTGGLLLAFLGAAWAARRRRVAQDRARPRGLGSKVLPLVLMGGMSAVPPAIAGSGDVDPTFLYEPPATPVPDSTNLLALDRGFIVVESLPGVAGGATTGTLRLTRIDENGTPVASFGLNGRLEQSLPQGVNLATAARLLPGGEILLGGFRRQIPSAVGDTAVIARLDRNGLLDPSLGQGGVATVDVAGDRDRVTSIDALPDGRIVASVWSRVEENWYDCDTESISLVRTRADGGGGELLQGWRSEPCRSAAALRVITDGFPEWNFGRYAVLVGSFAGLFRYDEQSASTTSIDAAQAGNGVFALGARGGLAYVRETSDGEQVVVRGSAPFERGLPLGSIAGFRSGGVTSAMASDPAGAWYVGFVSSDGEVGIAKYQSNGSIDTAWGGGDGVAVIRGAGAVPGSYSDKEPATDVRAISVRPDGNVVVATADGFVRRLVGASAPVNHGGIAIQQPSDWLREDLGRVSLRVSRVGGAAGQASVAYRVFAPGQCTPETGVGCGDPRLASEQQDFVPSSGRLQWGDGDAQDRNIEVTLVDDTKPEFGEAFYVELSDPQGGATILVPLAVPMIAVSDASEIRLVPPNVRQPETTGTVRVRVSRTGGLEGAASVTYLVYSTSPCAGNCAPGSIALATEGQDFLTATGRLDWGVGDGSDRFIDVTILDDGIAEPDEVFYVGLNSVPTGVAEIETYSVMMTIEASDQPPQPSRPSGGSGGGGYGGLALLCLLAALRRFAASARIAR